MYTDIAREYGFSKDNAVEDEARKCRSSSYAKAMGLYSNNGNCWWWLCSQGYYSFYAALVNFQGRVSLYGNDVSDTNRGVRPGIRLNITDSDLYSYAGTVCSDGTMKEVPVKEKEKDKHRNKYELRRNR